MNRPSRATARLRATELVPAFLTHGDRRCRGNLLNFSAANCAVRIHDRAFDHWTIADLRAHITLTLHGEARSARIVRIQRSSSPLTDNWVVGLVLR